MKAVDQECRNAPIYIILRKGKVVHVRANREEAEKLKSDLEADGLEKNDIFVKYTNALRDHLKKNPKPKIQNPPKPKPADYPDSADLSAATKLWNKVANRNKEIYGQYNSAFVEFSQTLADQVSGGKYTSEEIEKNLSVDRCFPGTFEIIEMEMK